MIQMTQMVHWERGRWPSFRPYLFFRTSRYDKGKGKKGGKAVAAEAIGELPAGVKKVDTAEGVNEPLDILQIVEVLAGLHQLPVTEMCEILDRNASIILGV